MSTELALLGADTGLDIDLTDIVIPRILLMQKMSDLVEEGQAAAGEIRESVDGALLGSEKHPMKFIVVAMHKQLLIWHDGEFKEVQPLTMANKNFLWEEMAEVDGKLTKITRNKAFAYYVLLPDLEEEGLPFVLSLTKTNTPAAKWINKKLIDAAMKRQGPESLTFTIVPRKEKNDKGSYFVYSPALLAEKPTPAMIERARYWQQALGQRVMTVVNTDVDLGDESGELS